MTLEYHITANLVENTSDDNCAVVLGWQVFAALERDTLTLEKLSLWWSEEDAADKLTAFMQHAFPGCVAIERQAHTLTFHLPSTGMTVSEMFHFVESHKAELRVAEYSISQTSLEQVRV